MCYNLVVINAILVNVSVGLESFGDSCFLRFLIIWMDKCLLKILKCYLRKANFIFLCKSTLQSNQIQWTIALKALRIEMGVCGDAWPKRWTLIPSRKGRVSTGSTDARGIERTSLTQTHSLTDLSVIRSKSFYNPAAWNIEAFKLKSPHMCFTKMYKHKWLI